MAKPERAWQVTKHGAIEKLDENLWSVHGEVPGNPKADRRMAIVKRADGKLVFYNAVPLEESALAEVKAWGEPAVLILPYNLHMMDGHAFAERLKLTIYGPKVDAKMASRVKVAGGFEDFPSDATVSVESLAGTKNGEPVMITHSPDGKRTSLMFADVFMNMPSEGASFLPRLIGMTGGPKVPGIIKMLFVKDKPALRSHLDRLASMSTLARLIPSHGGIVSEDAAGVLKRAAATV